MDTNGENQFSMMLVTEEVLDQYETTLSAVPLIATKVAAFKNGITLISDLEEELSGKGTGAAITKEGAKKDLAIIAHTIVLPLCEYLEANGDPISAKNLRKTVSVIEKLPDTTLSSYISNIKKAIAPIAVALAAATTVDQDAVDSMDQALLAYNQVKSKPGLSIAQRKTKGAAQKAAIKANLTRLKGLDNSIAGFRLKNPTLFSDYTNGRVIKDLGGSNPRLVKTIAAGEMETFIFTSVANSSVFSIRYKGTVIAILGIDAASTQSTAEVVLENGISTSRKASIFQLPGITGLAIYNKGQLPAEVTVVLVR